MTDYNACLPDLASMPNYGDMRVGAVHDWRLFERNLTDEMVEGVWRLYELWYCTRCRLVDERKVMADA